MVLAMQKNKNLKVKTSKNWLLSYSINICVKSYLILFIKPEIFLIRGVFRTQPEIYDDLLCENS